MQNKNLVNGKIGQYIVFGIIILFMFPFLIPFAIFGLFFYFNSNKIKNLNYLSKNKAFQKIKESNPDIYKLLEKKFGNNKQKNNKSKITESIESTSSVKTNYDYNYKQKQKPIEDLNKKSKISYSKPTNNSQEKHEFNGSISIWDDYETVVDKINKK